MDWTLKPDLNPEDLYSSAPEYDVFEYDYMEPKNILKDPESVKKVEEALVIVKKYLSLWEENDRLI